MRRFEGYRGRQVPRRREVRSVLEDAWAQEFTEDGKVFFANYATGVSQWHTPNELYESQFLCIPEGGLEARNVSTAPGKLSSSKAPNTYLTIREEFEAVKALREQEKASTAPPLQEDLMLQPLPVLQLTIHSAANLRDTDFMVGKDKSDPYVLVQIPFKYDCDWRTAVFRDSVDPEWEHTQIVKGWQPGDRVLLTVLDKDDVNQAKNGKRLSECCFTTSDDVLGRLELEPEDCLEESGPRSYRLREDGDHESYLTLSIQPLSGWPGLVGEPVQHVQAIIQRACPELSVMVFENPHEGSKVVSYDVMHSQGGYTGNFFGAYADDAELLEPGDTLEIAGATYTVAALGEMGGTLQMLRGRQVRYVHMTQEIQGTLRDGKTWRKVTQTPDPFPDPGRVCIWFDRKTRKVVRVPIIG